MDKKLVRWLELPPIHWDSHVQKELKSRKASFQELDDELRWLATRCAMLAEYIAHRTGVNGCGSASHEESVKQANKTRTKIRKALDFTMPSAGEFTF